MAFSYEFSIGSVRAKEKSLLSYSDLEQMINVKNEDELVKLLKDKGYGDGDSTDELIASHTEKIWKYIKNVSPDMSIFEPFFMQNDIHNLKTTLKGVMSDTEYSHLLLHPCNIDIGLLKKAVENNKFDILPEWLSQSAAKAYKLLAQTGDARLSDSVIDRSALEKMIEEGNKSKSDFICQYFNIFVFYADIKIALRASRLKTTNDYLDNALCECQGFDKKAVISKTLSSQDSLIKYLETISLYDCKIAVACYKNSPCEFERFVDNKLMLLAKQLCRFSCQGPEPLLGYYLGCEYEKQAVHIISSGIVTQTSPDKIRERLRETYG